MFKFKEISNAVSYAIRRHESYITIPLYMTEYDLDVVKEWARGSFDAYNFDYKEGLFSFDF
jgi:hypothetical protein